MVDGYVCVFNTCEVDFGANKICNSGLVLFLTVAIEVLESCNHSA